MYPICALANASFLVRWTRSEIIQDISDGDVIAPRRRTVLPRARQAILPSRASTIWRDDQVLGDAESSLEGADRGGKLGRLRVDPKTW